MKWLKELWEWFAREPAYLFDEESFQKVFGNGRDRHADGSEATASDAETSGDVVRREETKRLADSRVE